MPATEKKLLGFMISPLLGLSSSTPNSERMREITAVIKKIEEQNERGWQFVCTLFDGRLEAFEKSRFLFCVAIHFLHLFIICMNSNPKIILIFLNSIIAKLRKKGLLAKIGKLHKNIVKY